MQNENKLFDDLARVAGGALGALTGVRDEVESRVRQQVDAVLARLNLVTREEHEAVLAMVAAAREAQERLEKRLDVLERQKPAKSKPQQKE